jgi:hypothetical protein
MALAVLRVQHDLVFFYTLTVEAGRQDGKDCSPARLQIALAGFSICNPIALQTKEDSMKWWYATDEELHVEVHIDFCPDHSLHIQINNVCLHLCQKDFLQLARAVKNTADQILTAQAATKVAKPQVH